MPTEITYLFLEPLRDLREEASPMSAERKLFCDKSYEINGMYPDRQRHFRKRERPGQPEHCKVQHIWVIVNDGPRATGRGYFLLGGHGNILGD